MSLAGAETREQYRRSRSEQVGVFLRGDWWRIVILGLFLVGGIAPLVMAFLISLKTIPQFARQPFALTFPLHWENYGFAFEIVLEFIKNSMIISGVTVVGVLLLASLSAYAFGILEFPGRQVIFYLVLALMMVPSAMTLIPVVCAGKGSRPDEYILGDDPAVDRERTGFCHVYPAHFF